jgi:peptide chain release factor 3
MNWPIGQDGQYQGVYDRREKKVLLFAADMSHGQHARIADVYDPEDPEVLQRIGEDNFQQLKDDIELLDDAGESFDMDKVNKGELTPMFFGSAMTNFGVQDFLEGYIRMAPTPQPRPSSDGIIQPMMNVFRICVQDPGKYESCPQGSFSLCADMLGKI